MRIPRFTTLQLMLGAALVALVLGLFTSSWRASGYRQIQCVRFSPGGSYLAARYAGGAVQVWRVDRGAPRRAALAFHRSGMGYDQSAIQFSTDDRLLKLEPDYASGSVGTTVHLLDLRTLQASEWMRVRGHYTHHLAQLAGADHLCTTDYSSGEIVVYSLREKKADEEIAAANATFVALAGNGKSLAVAEQNGGLAVLDAETGTPVRRLSPRIAQSPVAFSADGSRLAVLAYDPQAAAYGVMLCDVAAGGCSMLPTEMTNVSCLALSHDGQRVAVGNGDAIEVFAGRGRRLSRIVLDQPGAFARLSLGATHQGHDCFAISPDGMTLATFYGGQAVLLDATTGQVRHRIAGGSWLLQIVVFTLGFALWAAAWGIVAMRARGKWPVSRSVAGPPPLALRLVWGLMIVGGLTALAIPITFLFLSGPWIFVTLYYSLFLGLAAIARGAARDTQALYPTAILQAINIIACDPVNLLLGAMEETLLRRPQVQAYLLKANGGYSSFSPGLNKISAPSTSPV